MPCHLVLRFLSLVKGSNTTPFETRSGDQMTCYRLTNQKISCKCFGALGKRMLLSVVSTTIRYTHFHWLIYKLKRSRQEVTSTCHKPGCVRSFHKRQKQIESEMKGLILIRLVLHVYLNCIISCTYHRFQRTVCSIIFL